MMRTPTIALLALASCNTLEEKVAKRPDPAEREVRLAADAGWDGYLLLDTREAPIRSVAAYQVFEQFGSPEVVALDELGRCHVLVPSAGRWSDLSSVHDAEWLGPRTHGDVDPRIDGSELYVSGQSGNVYQVAAYKNGALDSRLVSELGGREVHTLISGDLDPARPGSEILAFTRPGGLFQLTPSNGQAGFEVETLDSLRGRVTDALVLPGPGDEPPTIVTAARDGRLSVLQLDSGTPRWGVIHDEPVSMGRVALRPLTVGPELVLYSTCDDGRVLRHERTAFEGWQTQAIFAGSKGPHGLAAGRFHEDPALEAVAVFGEGRDVHLITRTDEGWRAEPIFECTGGGRWLATAEVDGRNSTDELLCGSDSGRVVMLARPSGFGLYGVATPPERQR